MAIPLLNKLLNNHQLTQLSRADDMFRLKKIFRAAVVLICVVISANHLDAKILVIAPHPDDDIITSAGVISRAIERQEPVRVVYMTNGDKSSVQRGYERQAEAVAGENYLGVPEDDLIFFGYPDGGLYAIFNSYIDQTDRYISSNGVSETYGNRGLGHMDYHSYRFGVPAIYNRFDILMDLEDILTDFLPEDIFVTSEFDEHRDHLTTYQLLMLALSSIHDTVPDYIPVIHKTIVHWEGDVDWPDAIDSSSYFSQIPDLASTGLSWSDRESLDVPLAMQSKNYANNPKYLALSAHATQGGAAGPLGGFIHKDEIFWNENVSGSNQPPIVNAGLDQAAMEGQIVHLDGSKSKDPEGDSLSYHWVQKSGIPVELSNSTDVQAEFTAPSGIYQNETLTFELVVSDQQFSSVPDAVNVYISFPLPTENVASSAAVTASSEDTGHGQFAVNAVDGVIDGYPNDDTKEWSSFHEKSGAWIQLKWPNAYLVDRIILYDRPNIYDQILSATLSFNDGSTLQVGPLDNTAGATAYNFPAKVITSVKMTVDQVSSQTSNVGLAEFEVYGVNFNNLAPVANAGSDQEVSEDQAVTLDGSGSHDPDGNSLTYFWHQSEGDDIQVILSDPEAVNPSFMSPTGLSQNTALTFNLTVNDGQLNSLSDSVVITVLASQVPCPGDFNHDGDVDGSDLAVFAADFGRTNCAVTPLCKGDFDTDGDVDGSDLATFAADFGRTDCPAQ